MTDPEKGRRVRSEEGEMKSFSRARRRRERENMHNLLQEEDREN